MLHVHFPTARMAFGLIRYLITIKQSLYFQQSLQKAQSHGLLVLFRNRGERIIITRPEGEQIQVYVAEVKDTETQQLARIGIEAPRHVSIQRPECRNHRENQRLIRLARTFCRHRPQ